MNRTKLFISLWLPELSGLTVLKSKAGNKKSRIDSTLGNLHFFRSVGYLQLADSKCGTVRTVNSLTPNDSSHWKLLYNS